MNNATLFVRAASLSLIGMIAFHLHADELAVPRWISAANAPVASEAERKEAMAPCGTSRFLKEFKFDKEIAQAKLKASGLGVFNVYVNGRKIGDEFLKPGFTHYLKTKYFYTWDVTAALKSGKGDVNRIEAEVSTGWWADKCASYHGHSAFWCELELTFADGTTGNVATGPDWTAAVTGPVTRAGIFDGEFYDARVQVDYTAFKSAEVNKEFNGWLLPVGGAQVYRRNDLTLKPVETYVWKGVEGAGEDAFGRVIKIREYKSGEPIELNDGETLIVDFGQNAAAVPEFKAVASKDVQLVFRPAEMLNDGNGLKSRGNDGPGGSVYRVNLRKLNERGAQLHYTFADDQPVTYSPEYTFFGYRYVSVTTTGKVRFVRLVSVPVTSISAAMERGTIETGVKEVNRLIENIRWGQYSNYLSVPTDCPQRDERQGWTADTQVFCKAGSFNADTYDFFFKFMRDLRDTQRGNGSYTGVAPLGCYWDCGDGRLGWSDCGIIVPYVMWRQSGRTEMLKEYWQSMSDFAAFIIDNRYAKGCSLEYQWADWLSYEKYESCSGAAWTNVNGERKLMPEGALYWKYLGACYAYDDARMMAEMAEALGKTSEAELYRKSAVAILSYVREELLEDGRIPACLRDMQTPALFALHFGLLKDEQAIAETKASLKKNIADHGGCLQTGFLGTSILMDTITFDVGDPSLAYSLLLQHNNPSWLYSVDQGATTIWERWNSYTKEKGFGPVGMNSFNHYAYGAVLSWMYEVMAGIRAGDKPGFDNQFMLAPIPDPRMGYVKASYRTANGLIRSEWKYTDGKCMWKFSIPKGSYATVKVNGIVKRYESGDYELEIK